MTRTLAQRAKTHRVAVVFYRVPQADFEGPNPRHPSARYLRDALQSYGWSPGTNIELLVRSAEGELDRSRAILEELVSMPVDVIVTSGNEMTRAAMRSTRTIPIVMFLSNAPVESGLVSSLTRPGGNVTGLMYQHMANLNAKRLELLKQVAPKVTRVAFLHDARTNSMSGGITPETRDAARELGITLLPFGVDTRAELDDAMNAAIRQGANGVFVDTSLSASVGDQPAFHAYAERHKLPAMHTYRSAVQSGGLMYYGQPTEEIYRRVAYYVDRILRGGKPAEMPIEQPATYQLVINRKGAKAIGLSIPSSMLAQVDQVID